MRKYYVIHAVIVTESVIRLVRPHILTMAMAMLGANSSPDDPLDCHCSAVICDPTCIAKNPGKGKEKE